MFKRRIIDSYRGVYYLSNGDRLFRSQLTGTWWCVGKRHTRPANSADFAALRGGVPTWVYWCLLFASPVLAAAAVLVL